MVEPIVKAYVTLWLVRQGAHEITVSIDGAEPTPNRIREILMAVGYAHDTQRGSTVGWTGKYARPQSATIRVISKPGTDVLALFKDSGRWVIECKGEPTVSGQRSGEDRTLFYTALGQLLMTPGLSQADRMLIAVPESTRLRALAKGAVDHSLLRMLALGVVMVHRDGRVEEVQ